MAEPYIQGTPALNEFRTTPVTDDTVTSDTDTGVGPPAYPCARESVMSNLLVYRINTRKSEEIHNIPSYRPIY